MNSVLSVVSLDFLNWVWEEAGFFIFCFLFFIFVGMARGECVSLLDKLCLSVKHLDTSLPLTVLSPLLEV